MAKHNSSETDSGSPPSEAFTLFGCGNMAGAILAGWVKAGADPATFTVVDPGTPKLPEGVPQKVGDEAAKNPARTLMLGIKPQMLRDLAPQAEKLVAGDGLVVSMLAGIELATLQRLFPGRAVLRLMPNLAAEVRKSPYGLVASGVDEARHEEITGWFTSIGSPIWLEEDDMALFTALAGSGPAYLFRFIDALADAAHRLGMDRESADRAALATVEGSTILAAEASESPGALADRVASPGGSTREGMNVLDSDEALVELLERTLAAARDRNIELARAAD